MVVLNDLEHGAVVELTLGEVPERAIRDIGIVEDQHVQVSTLRVTCEEMLDSSIQGELSRATIPSGD
jgi:hypothetical protein